MLAELPRALKGLPDLERSIMRILHGTSAPAELVGTLHAISGIGPALCGPGGGAPEGIGPGSGGGGLSGVPSPLLLRLLSAVTSEEVHGLVMTAAALLNDTSSLQAWHKRQGRHRFVGDPEDCKCYKLGLFRIKLQNAYPEECQRH